MASYSDLYDLFFDAPLLERIQVAVIVAAEVIRTEDPGTTNHANRLVWARNALNDTRGAAEKMLRALLAINKDLTTAQIQGATDSAVQTQVNNAVDLFAA